MELSCTADEHSGGLAQKHDSDTWPVFAFQEKLGKVYEKTFAEIRSSLSGDTYANVHDWMQAEYLANPAQLMSELKELEGECRQILGLPGSSNIQSTVPDSLVTDQDRRFKLALWQFGFLADSQLKGPVQSYAVSLTCTQSISIGSALPVSVQPQSSTSWSRLTPQLLCHQPIPHMAVPELSHC